jgi:hypothetical protein
MNQEQLEKQLIDCHDDRDPISMAQFWTGNEKTRTLVYPRDQIKELVFYTDTIGRIRCFEKESLQYLKTYNMMNHPVTSDPIPSYLFDDINIVEKESETIEMKAFNCFQLLANISIFIDYNLFLNLNKNQLITFYKELKDFWLQNFTSEQRQNITTDTIFTYDVKTMYSIDINKLKNDIIHDIMILLQCNIMEYQYMIHSIVIGSMGLVVPEIKMMYPDFAYEF